MKLDAHRTYYLNYELSRMIVVMTLIKTLTVSLTNVDDIESKLKQTSFSVAEDKKTVSDLSSHLSKDDLDEISYKILSKFQWRFISNKC